MRKGEAGFTPAWGWYPQKCPVCQGATPGRAAAASTEGTGLDAPLANKLSALAQVLGVSSAPGIHGHRNDIVLCPRVGPTAGGRWEGGKSDTNCPQDSSPVGKSGPNETHLSHSIPEQGDSEGGAHLLAS